MLGLFPKVRGWARSIWVIYSARAFLRPVRVRLPVEFPFPTTFEELTVSLALTGRLTLPFGRHRCF